MPALHDVELPPRTLDRLPLGRWVMLCAGAEAIGMAASAGAARLSNALVAESGALAFGLALVVIGGLIEGLALGVLLSAGLKRWLPELDRTRWIVVTTAIGGLGWAAASIPTALSGVDDGTAPPVMLIAIGALGLGAVMGGVLGGAQAFGLRGLVRHPWRWLTISAIAWTPTMAVIFVGATTPNASWPDAAVIGFGTLTGLVAGAILGLLSRPLFPLLEGSTLANQVVLGTLDSPLHRLLDGSVLGIRLRGAVTGRVIELPVQYAVHDQDLVIVPVRSASKRWWRNLRHRAAVGVLLRGEWRPGIGSVLLPGDQRYHAARSAYGDRWPRVGLSESQVIVLIARRDA